MCSPDKLNGPKYRYYLQNKPAFPYVYYKVNKKTGEAYYFVDNARTWTKSKIKPGKAEVYLERNTQPIIPPTKPISCDKCNNRGCSICRHIPWSIYNVFKK